MSGVFAQWQPRYAKHGVATFPVENKKPCVRGWQSVGLKSSTQLALKFVAADGFGFQCGKLNKITLIDIDSCDQGVVGEAIKLFGESPIIWRTGSGNYAMPFRHNGEARRIRPVPGLPIDVLGRGFAVAPPSMGSKTRYEFLQGSLPDLDRLPFLRRPKLKQAERQRPPGDTISEGMRDDTLFRYALAHAPYVDCLDALLDVLRTRNLDCEPPLPDVQVIRIVQSAWRYQQEGKNLVGRGRAFVFANADYERLQEEGGDAAVVLYCELRSKHWNRDFVLTKQMAAAMGWGLPKWKKARDTLVRLGFIHCIHPGGEGPHDPPIYAWVKGC